MYSFCWIHALFLTIVFAGSLCWIMMNRSKNKYKKLLPPGPPGLPILGHLHILGDLPHQKLSALAKTHGPIMYIRLGLVPAIVVSSPEMAELFLKTHDIVFASRPKLQFAEYITYGNKGLALAPYGSYWRNIRKFCTLHLLTNLKIESFRSMREEEVRSIVESIKDETNDDDEGGERVVNLSARVGSLSENITYRMVFGVNKDLDHKYNFKTITREVLGISGAFNLADYIPFIGAIDLQGLKSRLKSLSKILDELLEMILNEHLQNARTQEEHHRDFVDGLLSLMGDVDNAATHEEDKQQLGRSHVKAILLNMAGATVETSATTVEWALSELLRHPRVMTLLQNELERAVGLDRMVNETDLVNLDYLDMVIKETMRLHAVVPLLLPRESMEDININGYDIPKKSRIMVNVWAIGRDPQVWSENAQEFYPERFIGADIDLKGQHFELIPFGSGRRGCPGMQLGLTMARLMLAQLVHCFEWKLPNKMSPHDLDMGEKFGMTVPRASHLLAVPKYRLGRKQL